MRRSYSPLFSIHSPSRGFTLIELLIVMSVLIILASTVIVAINPLEQLNKADDTRRISAVVELGHSMESLATTRFAGKYPNDPINITSWQTSFLVNSGEIPAIVTVKAANSNCTVNPEGNLCYVSNGIDAVIWTITEANSNRNIGGCTMSQQTIVAWIGSQGKTGITCISNPSVVPSYFSALN